MVRSFLLPLAVLVCGQLWSQVPGSALADNGDCTGAIVITDSIFHQEQAPRGFGNILEIKENPADHTQWFEREHHSTWYKFRAPVKTKISFDIIPDNVEDDIDFLVFEGAIPGICNKIISKEVQPIRSNISRNDLSNGSRCGLSLDSEQDFVRSGVGASYSRALDVEEGELFYIVVDYQDRPRAGYTIHFHYDPPPPPPPVDTKPKQKVLISITDARSGKPVEADLAIEGMVFDKVVEAKGNSTYSYEMDPYRTLKIGCVRRGYMFYSAKVKGCMDPEVKVEVALLPIVPGEHVVLDDIRFVGNESTPLRSSEASLLMLLHFMQENPKVRIQVEGHVNGPTFKNTKEFIELSTSRAKAVYDFLMVNDIDPERISYKGSGNSQMLYPEPKNKEQSEANRRVEINVIGN